MWLNTTDNIFNLANADRIVLIPAHNILETYEAQLVMEDTNGFSFTLFSGTRIECEGELGNILDALETHDRIYTIRTQGTPRTPLNDDHDDITIPIEPCARCGQRMTIIQAATHYTQYGIITAECDECGRQVRVIATEAGHVHPA